MSIGIENLKLRIQTLEKLIENQSQAYFKGYVQGLKDNGLLLDDIDVHDLEAAYRSQLYTQALTHYQEIQC